MTPAHAFLENNISDDFFASAFSWRVVNGIMHSVSHVELERFPPQCPCHGFWLRDSNNSDLSFKCHVVNLVNWC